MKARIDAEGTLTVEAETPLEAWALQNWEKHYGKGKKGERTSLKVKAMLLPSEISGWVPSVAVSDVTAHKWSNTVGYTNTTDLTGGSLS